MKKFVIIGSVVAGLLFSGCGETKPGLNDAVKGSFKIHNGMTMEQVQKIMKIDPTEQEKIGDTIIWKYEGNTEKGEDEDKVIKFNSIVIKFKDGKVVNSGTFSCNLPKVQEE